jgi:hypothetical protein
MKTLEQHIEEVGDWFDFNKVHQVMLHLDWKWQNGVPEIVEMRQTVRKYMRELHAEYVNVKTCNVSMGSGGFDVRYVKGIYENKPFDTFYVAFNLASWDTENP